MNQPSSLHLEIGALDVPLRAENELQTEMRLIVESLYGPSVRRLPGLDLGRSYWGATKEFRYGGDMVDIFHYNDGRTSLAVVDISGHGILAARHAGLAKYALRAYASRRYSAVESVRALNRLYFENSTFEGDHEFFATAFFGIVDPERRSLQYVSAGHDAACIIRPDRAHILDVTAPIVGLIMEDDAFHQEVVPLARGDIFAAVTDGFTEARNDRLAFLGAAALARVIEQNRELQAEEQAIAVTRYAYEYAGARLEDDVAALVMRVDLQST